MVRRPTTTSTPIRMCVGCRRRAPAAELLRVVAAGDVPGPGSGAVIRLVPDPRRRLVGRGANLHLQPDCLALAERRRAFSQALRLTGTPDVSAVRSHVVSSLG